MLRRVAEQTGGRLLEGSTAQDLPDIARKISTDLRNRYVIGYSPHGQNAGRPLSPRSGHGCSSARGSLHWSRTGAWDTTLRGINFGYFGERPYAVGASACGGGIARIDRERSETPGAGACRRPAAFSSGDSLRVYHPLDSAARPPHAEGAGARAERRTDATAWMRCFTRLEFRTLRRQPVFTTPNCFPPAGFESPALEPVIDVDEADRPHCYVCKQKYTVIHHFYDQMCLECAEFNFAKRTEFELT